MAVVRSNMRPCYLLYYYLLYYYLLYFLRRYSTAARLGFDELWDGHREQVEPRLGRKRAHLVPM